MARKVDFMQIANLVEDIGSMVDASGAVKKNDARLESLKEILFYNLMSETARDEYEQFVGNLHDQRQNVGVSMADAYKLMKENGLSDDDDDPEESLFAGLMDQGEYDDFERLMSSNPGYRKNGWNARKYFELALEKKDKESNNGQRLLLAKLFKTILDDKGPKKKPGKESRIIGGKVVYR